MRVSNDALKLLRALAGNDAIKSNILKNDGAKLIDEIINMHKVKCMCNNIVHFRISRYAK